MAQKLVSGNARLEQAEELIASVQREVYAGIRHYDEESWLHRVNNSLAICLQSLRDAIDERPDGWK